MVGIDGGSLSSRRLFSTSVNGCLATPHDPLVYYPRDYFTTSEREDGALVLHFLFMFYLFIVINTVLSQRLVPATRSLSTTLGLRMDVTESLMLAGAHGIPLVFVCWVGTFFNRTSVGLATMLGAAIFHYMLVMGISVCAARTRITLSWMIASRDFIAYMIALTAVLFIVAPLSVQFWHAIILVGLYAIYIGVLQHNDRITQWVLKMVDADEKPRKKSEKGRRQSFELLVTSVFFDIFIYLVIITNIVVIILQNVDSTSDISAWATLNQVFTAVFVAEMAIKIYVFGFFGYWRDPLNAFDGMLVYLILVEFVVAGSGFSGSVRIVRLVRVFRALRALRAARLVTKTDKPDFVKQASREPPLGINDPNALPPPSLAPPSAAAPVKSMRGSMIAALLELPPALPPPTDRIVSPEVKTGDPHHQHRASHHGAGPHHAPQPSQVKRLGTSPRPSYDRDANKTETRIEAANQADLDGEPHHILALPHGCLGWLMYVISLPVLVLVYLTIPDPRRDPFKKWWLLTMIISLIWLACSVYLMVWMATIISVTWNIDDSVIGLTFLAVGLTLPDLYRSLSHVAMVDRVAAERIELLRTRSGAPSGVMSMRQPTNNGAISIAVSEANAVALVTAAHAQENGAAKDGDTAHGAGKDGAAPVRTHTAGNSLIVLPPGTVGVGAHHQTQSSGSVGGGGGGGSLPTATPIDINAATTANAPGQPPSPLPGGGIAPTANTGASTHLSPIGGGLMSIGTGSKRHHTTASHGAAGLASKRAVTTHNMRRTRTSQSNIPKKTRSGRRPYDNPHLSLMLGRHIFALMIGLGFPWFFYTLVSSDGSTSLSIPIRQGFVLTIVTAIVMITIMILLIHWLEWLLHRGIAVVGVIFWCWFIVQYALLEEGYLINFDDCNYSS